MQIRIGIHTVRRASPSSDNTTQLHAPPPSPQCFLALPTGSPLVISACDYVSPVKSTICSPSQGPSHSGVIGVHCPRYTFFGDTVRASPSSGWRRALSRTAHLVSTPRHEDAASSHELTFAAPRPRQTIFFPCCFQVNVASRMESHGHPMSIHVSLPTPPPQAPPRSSCPLLRTSPAGLRAWFVSVHGLVCHRSFPRRRASSSCWRDSTVRRISRR